MNPVPARLLRPFAEICKSRPPPPARDHKRRDYLIEAARNMFIQYGRSGITLSQFALATGISQLAIKQQIGDLHHLFGLVLTKHLDSILDAVSYVDKNAPDLRAARRAGYFRATRGICNVPTPLHFLLMRDRFTLPQDELESIETQRRIIGYMLGGDDAEPIMALLDCPTTSLEQIEAMIAPLNSQIPLSQTAPEASRPAPPPPAEIPLPQSAPPDPALRTSFLADFRRKPFPVFPPDKASTDRLAEYSDAELTAAADAGLDYPIGPPSPRPAWSQSLLDDDDEEDEPKPLPRAASH